MNENNSIKQCERYGKALAFIFYPIFAGFAFAAHPNLLDMSIDHTIQERITEFHGNDILHFGHVLMILAVPMLITIALHFMGLLRNRAGWWGFIGGNITIVGAVILAVDKGALCLVPSAFDIVPKNEYASLVPGIEAMFHYKGWLWLLYFLPLLPIGFVIQSIGLVRSKIISRRLSIPTLIGSLLMINPDIDIIGLVATIFLAIGFLPYAAQLIHETKTNPHLLPQYSAASSR